MIIRQILAKYQDLEIDILLSEALKKSREFLFMNQGYRISESQSVRLQKLIKRRQKGEPIAYMLGYKDFCGLRFKVNKHVLIPRPETETLVELALDQIQNAEFRMRNRPTKILDVGTGSGAVIVSIAREFTKMTLAQRKGHLCVEFYASDISSEALKVAKANAKAHKVNIKFIKSDLFKNIKGKFDIIVANLPYGWKEWKNNTSAATIGLKFEPKQALFTGKKGLYEISRLLEQISGKTKQPYAVFLEFDPRQKSALEKEIKKILPNAGVRFYKDFNSLWRIAEIILQPSS